MPRLESVGRLAEFTDAEICAAAALVASRETGVEIAKITNSTGRRAKGAVSAARRQAWLTAKNAGLSYRRIAAATGFDAMTIWHGVDKAMWEARNGSCDNRR